MKRDKAKDKEIDCFVALLALVLELALTPLIAAQEASPAGEVALGETVLGDVAPGSVEDMIGTVVGWIISVLLFLIIIAAMLWILYRVYRVFSPAKEAKEVPDMKERRKLSAIMFTDMKGYSKEMGRAEEATLRKVLRYEKAIKDIIEEHGGRVVKTIGDAVMGDFDSAVNAVKCALSLQEFLRKEDIKIRIGVHIGDVIYRAGDVFGDAVNIASRIESVCEPGEVYISEDTYNQMRGKIPARFESIGSRRLKNIEKPPKLYKVA
ncbi:MAG: adenylate/guanylate cyclase domain-containing protein [Candidatus Micrarchaeia archaeon]